MMVMSMKHVRLALVAMLALGILTVTLAAEAQEFKAERIPRIGYLSIGPGPSAATEAFRQGLRELGYVEGQSILVECRYAEGRVERLPALAAELLDLRVGLIVVLGNRAVRAARQVTSTVPIVVAFSSEVMETGFVASLARPGGNITGLTTMSPELTAKRLELLKEGHPKVSRVAILWNSIPGKDAKWGSAKAAAQVLAVKLQSVEVRASDDLDRAFAAMTREHADALLTFTDSFTTRNRKRIVDLAAKHRLPAIYEVKEFVDAGGLMSYGPDIPDMNRRAATYVDKILKGAKPGDLPVEQPTKFELRVNLKTAKALGLTIPPAVLIRADQIID
jgi:putative ABC transport system substrate-binding protein